MKLKCIGGKCDGQLEWVDYDRLKIGDAVRVNEPTVFKIEDGIPSTYEELVQKVVIKQHIYMIDCLKYSHVKDDVSSIWFLRPPNLTTFDAIQFQFLK